MVSEQAANVFLSHSEELAVAGNALAWSIDKTAEGLLLIGVALLSISILLFFKWVTGCKCGK